jgi:hypothetical protein
MEKDQEQKQERQKCKSSEGEFIYELRNNYELSPRMSESILESAKHCLIRDNVLKEGEIEVSVISVEERSGKTTESMRKQRVRLMLDNGIEDYEVLQRFGRIALRQVRIQRITQEAIEQGGVLSQEDLSKYLSCGIRTIKRDISTIKKSGLNVITRGALHNIGRGQTHKVKIVGLYLEGKTFSEISQQTHHSPGAIKRYIQDFMRVMMSIKCGLEGSIISSVSGLSENLVGQYKRLLEESQKDSLRRATIKELVKQWRRAGTRIKKKWDTGIVTAVHMTGGGI